LQKKCNVCIVLIEELLIWGATNTINKTSHEEVAAIQHDDHVIIHKKQT